MLARERTALLALGLGTAAILPGALNRFVFPKLSIVLIGAVLGAWCTARGRLPRAVVVMLSASGLVLALAALTGSAPVAQLLGRPPRYEGLLALSVYAGALAAGARLLGPDRPGESMSWLLDCVAAAAILIALEAVLETAGHGALAGNVARPGSLLGNASDEGAWAVLALGPLACVAIRTRAPLPIAGALAAGVTLVCSGSRGALIGAAALLVVMMVRLDRPARVAALAGAALILAGTFVVPTTRRRLLDTSPHSAQSVTGHRLLATETSRLIGEHPLLGVGPSGFVDAIPREHDARWERQIGPANPPDSPENWLLQAAGSGGIPLLLLALGLTGTTLRAGARAARGEEDGYERAAMLGMFAGLVGYAVALLFHFTSPGTAPLAALFAGAVLAERPRAAPARHDRPMRAVATVAAGALFVVLAAGAVAEVPLRSALIHAGRGQLADADHDFDLARDLRPWDAGVAADATHAYAVLAEAGVGGAATRGRRWAARETDAWPDSVPGLSDSATLDALTGRAEAARRALARARALDPHNPQLRLRGGQ